MGNTGRPKKEGLDKIIKVTVNDEMAEMLEHTVQETGKSKSDILRELIPIVSSKSFEELVPRTSMEVLQNYSDRCWDILHTPGCIFDVGDLANKMPAFVATVGRPRVYVKYPTFKIQIFDARNPRKSTSQKDIERLLQAVPNRSDVCADRVDYLVIGGRWEEMEYPYMNEVTCLGVTLEENIRCKDTIAEILRGNGYQVSIFPAYCIRGDTVELLEEGKYFKVVQPE